jgi:peptide/nickel transport system substrate-binding protein
MVTDPTSTLHVYDDLPTTLNPLFARTLADQRAAELVFDRLFFRDPVANVVDSRLVWRSEGLDGGRRVQLYLVEGIRWHDGTPFGPEDVCFTVEAMLQTIEPAGMDRSWTDLAGCTFDEDAHTATVEFAHPHHDVFDRLSFHVLPAHVFDSPAVRPDTDFSHRPVGTGPMKGSMGRRSVRLSAYANPHHAPRIQTLSWDQGGDPFVQVRTLLGGGIHGIVTVPPPLRPEIAGSSGVQLRNYDLRSVWFMALNTQREPLSDQRVRQAVEAAIDREALMQLTVGITPEDPNPPLGLISGPFLPGSPYNDRTIAPRQGPDPARVHERLLSAGAEQRDGTWHLRGAPITIRIAMHGPLDAEAHGLLDQIGIQLRTAGFKTRLYGFREVEWSEALRAGRLSEYDALIDKWHFGPVDDPAPLLHTPDGERGAHNLLGYSNPEVDALLEELFLAVSEEEARAAGHALHRAVANDVPAVYLWTLGTQSAWTNAVGSQIIAPYHYYTYFDRWTYSP